MYTQALESEAIMGRFYTVHEKMSQVLEEVPVDELGISDEIKEQVNIFILLFANLLHSDTSFYIYHMHLYFKHLLVQCLFWLLK